MQIPSSGSGRRPPGAGRNAQLSAARAAPGETTPELDRTHPDADATWSADGQPNHARASFLKLCLPAVLYLHVVHASLKVLRLATGRNDRRHLLHNRARDLTHRFGPLRSEIARGDLRALNAVVIVPYPGIVLRRAALG